MPNKDCRNLGEAVSEYIRVTEIDSVDMRIAQWGDCVDQVARWAERQGDEVARKYGFENAAALLDAVAERTSQRFVYFHLPRFN